MRAARAARPRKFGHLPAHEIIDRLINTSATTRSLAAEYGCSDSTIKKLLKLGTTAEQRLAARYKKQADSIRGRPNPTLKEWRRQHDVWTGRKHTAEARQNQSKAKAGKRHPLEQRIALSARLQGIPVDGWVEFKSTATARLKASPEYKAWRKAVFARDDFTCRHCGAGSDGTSVYLEAHHILPKAIHPDRCHDITNGLSLCKPCHKRTDSYGRNLRGR